MKIWKFPVTLAILGLVACSGGSPSAPNVRLALDIKCLPEGKVELHIRPEGQALGLPPDWCRLGTREGVFVSFPTDTLSTKLVADSVAEGKVTVVCGFGRTEVSCVRDWPDCVVPVPVAFSLKSNSLIVPCGGTGAFLLLPIQGSDEIKSCEIILPGGGRESIPGTERDQPIIYPASRPGQYVFTCYGITGGEPDTEQGDVTVVGC